MPRNYVIVGAGPAGVIAAETVRKADPKGGIVVVGDEPEPPYSRMAIPYVLSGGIAEPGTYLRKENAHFENLGIRVVRDRVGKVAPKAGRVTLASGKTLPYDRLLVATGAHPIKPPIEGLDLAGVHHCWTLEDARAIARLAKPGARVVLMGAGFIGCIILESLIARGVRLIVVEAEDRMVPRMMDETAGAMLKSWCRAKGVTVKTSTRVTQVEKAKGGGLRVGLSKGRAVVADLLVVATGVAPNVGFLKGSGVKIENGVVVDDRLESSVTGIFAAGDVAEGPDFSGGWSVHAIQPTAADHARIAGLNMAGRDVRYQGSLVMNVLDTAGLITASFGRWQGVKGGRFATSVDKARHRYLRLAFAGDVIVGAVAVGRTAHVGVLRGLIQGRVALGPWRARLMKDPERIMDAYVGMSSPASGLALPAA